MDPFTAAAISATLGPLVTGAAGEAGKAAWNSLATFVKRTLGHNPAAVTAVDALEQQPADTSAVNQLADQLVIEANHDNEAAAWLRTWHDEAAAITTTTVHNSNSGTIHGNLAQGVNFGTVNF